MGDGLGSAGVYPSLEEFANRAIRMFSSVSAPGLAELGDLFARRLARSVWRGGGGPRLVGGDLAEPGASFTMGEYWEMDDAPL